MSDPLRDLAIEHAVLAVIIRDNAVLDSLRRLEPQHFFDAELRELFTAARDLRREGRAVNVATLRALTASDPLGGATLADRLKAVSFDGVEPGAQDMADALIDLAHRRELKALAEDLLATVDSQAKKPAALAETTMRELDRLLAAARPAGRTYWAAPDGMNEALDRLGRDDRADRLMTGIAALDRKTGGLHRRRTVYLAGRTSMGKSAVAITVAENVAKAGHGVLYLSLEMTLEELKARRASAATYRANVEPIAYDRALNRQLDEEEQRRFLDAGRRCAALPIAVEEAAVLSVHQIAARVRSTAQEFAGKGQRLGLVIVDHLGKVKPADLRAPLVQQLGQISNDLTALAKPENVAMLATHQLNRGVESREDKHPNLADLRDSGHLEQDGDAVWLLYREAYYLQRAVDGESKDAAMKRALQLEQKKRVLEIIVAKNRNGACGTVEAFCEMGFNVIADLDRRTAA